MIQVFDQSVNVVLHSIGPIYQEWQKTELKVQKLQILWVGEMAPQLGALDSLAENQG